MTHAPTMADQIGAHRTGDGDFQTFAGIRGMAKTIDDLIRDYLKQLRQKTQTEDYGSLTLTVKYQGGTLSHGDIIDQRTTKLLKES